MLALWLGAALWTDLRQRRIPNRLIVSGLAVALALHMGLWLSGRPSLAGGSFWAPWLGLLVGAGALLPGYWRAGLGAGDVKLMALVGAFLGPVSALWAALFAMVAGGLQSLGWWIWHRWAYRLSAPPMPYAPAIVVGSVVAAVRAAVV